MSLSDSYLLLSAQTALLGHVIPSLRAVTIDFGEKILNLRFFYDAEVTEELFDLASVTAAELELDPNSSFQYEKMNEDIAIHLNYPKPIPVQGKLIYLRKEEAKTIPSRSSISNEGLRPINVFRLAMQEALLARVTPNLTKIIVDLDEDKKILHFYFFYHAQTTSEDITLCTSIIQDVQHYFSDFKIDKQVCRMNNCESVSVKGCTVYSRAF